MTSDAYAVDLPLLFLVEQPLATPTIQEGARLVSNRVRVLQRLEAGSATNVELTRLGGMRFGGRLMELRQAGYVIESKQDHGGVWRYTLICSPEVASSGK